MIGRSERLGLWARPATAVLAVAKKNASIQDFRHVP